jgi:hypothetical protein
MEAVDSASSADSAVAGTAANTAVPVESSSIG